MTTPAPPNKFQLLRARRLAEATREFLARGKSVARCERCQLAAFACICPWQPRLSSNCDFVLLMHRDEVFKPTNTGRLVADVLPDNTHAFCWDRTNPELELLALLQDPGRVCVIVFPETAAQESKVARQVLKVLPQDERRITFILLDGTWKQSGRMFHLSRWLDNVALFALPESLVRGYAVRKSHQENYLATAEAAALCLQMHGDHGAAEGLTGYFQLFNLHYLATRGSYPPVMGKLHAQLSALKGD